MHHFIRTDCALLHAVWIVGIIIVSVIVPSTNTFNLDTFNYILYNGESDTMFGFSVALHREAQRSWVIVGAPRANLSRIQSGVSRGGAVYRCDIYADDRCHLIPFDSAGNQENEKGEQIDTKDNQWFGATVASAGIDGPLVACAPRYVFHTMQPRKVVRVEPVGTCYMAKKNFQEYTEYSPCRTMFWGYHKQGSCQAGMSAAITKNGDRLFIGAPGSWYWQGQSYSFSLNNPKDKVWATRESTAAEDDSYLGYSSITGDFTGEGNQGVAVGMPRGGGLLGKVLIFSWNMTNQLNITGEQIGAYFGYSLAVCDVDGDHLDDLIVGAPMHTEPNNEGKYEMGRVYVIYQEKFNKFQNLETRDGLNSRARFGLSLTSLGDINLDGFGDFAVGAPYDGPEGRGAVYIFHGSKEGVREKPSQVIFAEDIAGSGYMSTFGFSLSGGIDLDGNQYPDLVIGSYGANKAIVLKSRAVAVVKAETTFDVPSKLISLDDKKCKTIRDNKEVTCTTVKSCLQYTGINLPSQIDIDVSWILDAKKQRSPRLFFLNEEGNNIRKSTMRLNRGKTECRTERVYIADNVRDKLTPLEVEMRFNMRENTQRAERVSRSVLGPIIDQNRGTIERDSINIQKNCGPDNKCVPDLRLEVKTVETYIFGSKDLLVFDVKVSNFGEDAFEAGFFMNVPNDMNFRKIERIGDSRDTPITCTAPSPVTNHTLKCDIGNPLSGGKVANFKVILLPATKKGIAPKYDFFVEANSTNAENEGTESDNHRKITVKINVETNLTVTGVSPGEEILYNATDFVALENATQENQIGPQVVHMYEIRNGGPSTIEEAEVYFIWPYETLSGDQLLYLMSQPETTRNVKCELSQFVNVRGVELDRSLVAKSYLVNQGAVEKSSLNSASSFHSTGYAVGGQNTQTFTEEERRRFEIEESLNATGDASEIHKQRANEAAQEQGAGSSAYHQQSGTWGSGPATYSNRLNQSKYSTQRYDNSQQRSNPTVYSAGAFGSGSSGVRKIDDFSAEGSVNQDLSGTHSHGQSQTSQSVHSSQNEATQSATGSTGRRRMMSQQDGEAYRPGLVRGVSQYQNKDNFQVGTVELNTLGHDNVDEEIRRHGNAAHFANANERQSAGQSQSHSSGSSGSTSYQQKSSSSFSNGGGSSSSSHSAGQRSSSANSFQSGKKSASTYAGNSNLLKDEEYDDYDAPHEDYYDENDDEQNQQHQQYLQNQQVPHQQQQQQQQHYQQQQYRSSSNGNGANQKFQHYQRLRRDLGRDIPDFNDIELNNRFTCNRSLCAVIRCTTSQLDADSSAWIALRMRLVTQTLNVLAPNIALNLSTMVISRVARLPYLGEPTEKPLKLYELKISAVPIPEPKPDIVPLWIIILSACIGVIILLLLIYLLYKCGFFKRNRPDHSQERQPLNRNNGYHGDERL
ncbi:integrin alpha-PS2 isoform X2 [Contarinia nasturtii]|uniref:integrin alpha-PS2 isoform X2 n=1 Tax=Contarinia nasturtii TaxID=265458 RepID=UPI0012D3BED4|nr:integrin alpha-PS2 isoform X2 [Contarinia nasturtii]